MITFASRQGQTMAVPESISESLTSFREWIDSHERPDEGRWTYFRGQVLLDMAAEKVNAHADLKTEVTSVLRVIAKRERLGTVYADGVWYTDDGADLSNEPDASFLAHQSLQSGRVVLVKSDDDDGIEYRGGPDWALEVVSSTSVVKDTRWLPEAYFASGVGEYWLIDARGDTIDFTLYHRTFADVDAYDIVQPDEDGWRTSATFGIRVRLIRERNPAGLWDYTLQTR